jgi:hypothetical protein
MCIAEYNQNKADVIAVGVMKQLQRLMALVDKVGKCGFVSSFRALKRIIRSLLPLTGSRIVSLGSHSSINMECCQCCHGPNPAHRRPTLDHDEPAEKTIFVSLIQKRNVPPCCQHNSIKDRQQRQQENDDSQQHNVTCWWLHITKVTPLGTATMVSLSRKKYTVC